MAVRSPHQSIRGIGWLLLTLFSLPSIAVTGGTAVRHEIPGALVDSLYEVAAYEQALEAALTSLALARKSDDASRHELIRWLVRVGRCQIQLSHLEDARAALREAADTEAARSVEPDSITLELKRVSLWLEQKSWNPDAMLETAIQSVDLARRIHGPDDHRVAQDLIALAKVFVELDRPDEALALLEEAERLPAPGRESETIAAILTSRAEIALSRGDLEEPIGYLEQAVEIVQRSLGASHPGLGYNLLTLGEVRRLRGELDEAERCFRRALEIETASFGKGHPRTGTSLNNLGVVLSNKGDLTGAEDAYERSIAARISGSGEADPSVALTMVNLSSMKRAMGQEAEGVRLLRNAVEIIEASMGAEHSRTAWALSHLAQAERRYGRPAEAKQLFHRCLRIAESIHGPVHIDAVLYRMGIAQSLRDLGRLEAALEEFRKADAIGSELLGSGNAQIARHRREVGVTLLLLGRVGEAAAILEECAGIIERELGPEHPALNQCLAGLTAAAIRNGDIERAQILADRNLQTAERTFGESGLRRSLLMKLAVGATAGDWESSTIIGLRATEIALQTQDDLLQVFSEREMLTFVEHSRRVLGALLAALQTAAAAPDSILSQAFSMVARQHGFAVDRFAERRRLLEPAADTSAARVLSERHRSASERLDPEDVLARIEPETILIHFVRFPVLSIHTEDWRPGASSLEDALFHGKGDHYGAFRLRSRVAGEVAIDFTDLGDAAKVDTLIASYRHSIIAVQPGRHPTVHQETAYRRAARDLAEVIWIPLLEDAMPPDAELGEPPLVLLLPASWLHWVDFNTLLARDGQPLITAWRLHTLSSVRDLFRERRAPEEEGLLLAVGNPEGARPPDLCPRHIDPITPLPGAEEEVREIAGLYKEAGAGEVILLTGPEATETAVKDRIEHARIAHLATHGFYCEDLRFSGSDAYEAALDPLLRCGLILAPGREGDDGFLTAREIVSLDLRNLEYVVLSACESGLGPLISSEGLYGLRRAFEIAGTHTVITAIWRIGDRTTRDLMCAMYRRHMRKESTADALRSAQIERLELARKRNRIHPALWGGLIAEGDWRRPGPAGSLQRTSRPDR